MTTDSLKVRLLDSLRAELTRELESSRRRAHDAAVAATHEENRPENDKDMRSTEASYVARGQAERVREVEHALARLANMPVRDLEQGDAIVVSAIVKVRHDGSETTYFVVPAAGGVRLRDGDVEVQTLATSSPLGAALLGLSEGDEAEVSTPHGKGGLTRLFEVVQVR
ncbi:GreA/GreB family elongation factor [Pendulispora albinea]|uniref:GreA/GreB family elongation factor n=1 Tax=Pendulispora albinea TaxID=2741071 RepID=A0ABZ2M8G5_9BACT